MRGRCWLPGRHGGYPAPPREARTALRSGACGLEGLTGTESPAADGMYKTGPDWVGLDTAEEGCGSSLRGGSAKRRARCQQALSQHCSWVSFKGDHAPPGQKGEAPTSFL